MGEGTCPTHSKSYTTTTHLTAKMLTFALASVSVNEAKMPTRLKSSGPATPYATQPSSTFRQSSPSPWLWECRGGGESGWR